MPEAFSMRSLKRRAKNDYLYRLRPQGLDHLAGRRHGLRPLRHLEKGLRACGIKIKQISILFGGTGREIED